VACCAPLLPRMRWMALYAGARAFFRIPSSASSAS